MKTYRHGNGRIVARTGGGRFRQWDGDRDFGIRVCLWCNHFATRPEIQADAFGFIDPADMNRRVCKHCGWDSARCGVSRLNFERARQRYLEAERERKSAADAGAAEDELSILEHQVAREARQAVGLLWFVENEVTHG